MKSRNKTNKILIIYSIFILFGVFGFVSPSWAFSVSSTYPSNLTTDIPLGITIQIQFDSELLVSSVNSQTATLTTLVSQVPVPGTFIISSNNFSFSPLNDLKPGLSYVLTITTDIKDIVNNPLSTSKTIVFTTGFIKWHAGAYTLTEMNTNIAANNTFLTNTNAPYVSGIVSRNTWESLEPTTEGNYDWIRLDNILKIAKNVGKKVALNVNSRTNTRQGPAWIAPNTPLGTQVKWLYYYDTNPRHQEYCNDPEAVPAISNCILLVMPLPWDTVFYDYFKNFIKTLGNHYTTERADLLDTISYTGGGSGGASGTVTNGWNLPMRIFDSPTATSSITWQSLGYTSKKMIDSSKAILDVWMKSFSTKPHWDGVGHIKFEKVTTGNTETYVAEKIAEYGFSAYPDRFGIWREDLNSNKNNSKNPPANALWNLISQYRPKTGFQMVSGVRNCSGNITDECRMGSPGMTQTEALQIAIQTGSDNVSPNYGWYLSPYQEIYREDVENNTLNSVFDFATNTMKWQSDSTPPTSPPNFYSPTVSENSITLNWSLSTDNWDKPNNYTNSLTNPAPSLSVLSSVGYNIFRNGVLIANTESTSFIDKKLAPATLYNYNIAAFDAMGNISTNSDTLSIFTLSNTAPPNVPTGLAVN